MEKYEVNFKKKNGQNFLKDLNIVKRIVNLCDIDNDSLVIEVGPGGGVLTRELALVSKNVLAYEIDTDLSDELYKRLSAFDNVDIIFQDFLKSDISKDIENYSFNKIFFISNVPYYITTPIIFKLIKSNICFDKVVMMVQKEVGDRFTASVGSRDYGSITVLLNYFYVIKKEFFVSKGNFIPQPKVDSVIISFQNNVCRPKLYNFDFFERIVRDSFQFKRKTIKNNLKKYDLNIIQSVLNEYGFDLNVRAEMLDVEVFIKISNLLWK